MGESALNSVSRRKEREFDLKCVFYHRAKQGNLQGHGVTQPVIFLHLPHFVSFSVQSISMKIRQVGKKYETENKA